MASTYYSGKTAYVKRGTFSYAFSKWSLDCATKLPDVTNFTSAGFGQVTGGIARGTLTVSGPYHDGFGVFTSGEQYTWVLGFTSGVEMTVDARISSLKPDVDVDGNPIINISAMSHGTFTIAIA